MRYTYGPFDTLISIFDANNNQTAYTYDRLGRAASIQDPDRGSRIYKYDAFGEMTELDKGAAQSITYGYDALGRVKTMQLTPGGTATYTWDTAVAGGVGKLAAVDDPSGGVSTHYSYDGIGRAVAKTWRINGRGYTFGSQYDAVGRLDRMIYPAPSPSQSAFVVKYEYGNYGQLTAVHDPAGPLYWRPLEIDPTGRFGASNTETA
jgi:YD repeat-containing protein